MSWLVVAHRAAGRKRQEALGGCPLVGQMLAVARVAPFAGIGGLAVQTIR